MLEAALEQMDGIIQGAKYDMPSYFDNFSIQVITLNYITNFDFTTFRILRHPPMPHQKQLQIILMKL